MNTQPQFGPGFLAKCFAAYYNSPAYMAPKTTGVLGVMLDDIAHFGFNGWRLKLWPIKKLLPDHARMLLQVHKEIDLVGYEINVVDNEDVSMLQLTACLGGVPLFEHFVNYGPNAKFCTIDLDFLRALYYDMGFDKYHSLIEIGLAVDASLLNEGPMGMQAAAPLTFRQEYVNGLQLLARYAMAHNSTEHIGIIQALIGAELGKNTLELFVGMSEVIKKLKKDSDNDHQRQNN